MALPAFLKRLRPGRRPNEPQRDTVATPNWLNVLALGNGPTRTVTKPTPRNLRRFATTPYARRAINSIKNPIAMLDWEVVPVRGVELNSELERQIAVVTRCLDRPNTDDSFRSMTEQVLEDIICGAGALEVQLGGDGRPLWLFPVDGLSIRLNPSWNGDTTTPRYAQEVGRGDVIPLRNEELIYFRPNPSTHTPFGLGPLEVAFTSISRQLGVGEFAGNVASNARPSVMINIGKGASTEQVAAYRAYWTNDIEGQGKTPIGSHDGAEVMRLFPDGDSALYLGYQDFLKAEIAAAFDLSPMALGVERDVNRNTAEVMADRDMNHAIKPMADLFASHITREAIQGRLGFSQLELSFPALDAEDETALADNYVKEYKNNAVTPNIYLKRKGLPPLDSEFGDLLFCEADLASKAAQGAKQVLDPKLAKNAPLPAPDPEED